MFEIDANSKLLTSIEELEQSLMSNILREYLNYKETWKLIIWQLTGWINGRELKSPGIKK
jgi:hypothetical protein